MNKRYVRESTGFEMVFGTFLGLGIFAYIVSWLWGLVF